MKKTLNKILKLALVITLLGALPVVVISNASTIEDLINKIANKLSSAFLSNEPKHESDEMLLTDGDFYIQLNESSARSHLNSDVSNQFKELYKNVVNENIKDNIVAEVNSFRVMLQLQNDLGNKMYVQGDYTLDESGNITRCKYTWYDGKIIFEK